MYPTGRIIINMCKIKLTVHFVPKSDWYTTLIIDYKKWRMENGKLNKFKKKKNIKNNS